MVQLGEALVNGASDEKKTIGDMFDRETKRERNLEKMKLGMGQKKDKSANRAANITIDEEEYRKREETFFQDINMSGDDLGTTFPSEISKRQAADAK
jgi:hypothetical protein